MCDDLIPPVIVAKIEQYRLTTSAYVFQKKYTHSSADSVNVTGHAEEVVVTHLRI